MSETNVFENKALSGVLKRCTTSFEINGCRFFTFWCRVADEDRFNMNKHHHTFYELHVCLSGEVDIEIDGLCHTLQKGQFLFVPHGREHRIARASAEYSRLVWGVDVGGLQKDGEKAVYRSLTAEEKGLIDLILAYAKKGGSTLSGRLSALFGALFFSLSETAGAVVGGEPKKADMFALVDRYVQDNLFGIEGIEEVSAQFFMSARQLSRICEEETGVPFGKYLKLLKMEKAKQLLKTHTVKQTAELLGYSDEFAFSRAFYKVVGETPAKVRKK